MSVSVTLTLTPRCPSWRPIRDWRYSNCHHGRWRHGRHAARK